MKILLALFMHTKRAFYFSIILFLICVIFNSSFRIMGFDLSSEIKSIFKGEFLVLILTTNLKIFLVYFLFYSFLEIFLETENKIKSAWIYFIFSIITLFLFFHSVTKYPQIYGEFFYLKHTYLKSVLYFLTSNTNPNYYQIFFALMLFLILFQTSVKFFFESKLIYLFQISLLLLGLFFHVESQGIMFLILFLSYQVLVYFYREKIVSKLYLISVYSVLLTFIFAFYYFRDFYNFSSEENQTPNLILISADSLRFDKIGAKIGNEEITPNINLFSKDAYQFKNHHVTVPRTFPSWADLLTGEYGMSHKIRDMFPAPSERDNLGSEDFLTIGHYLKKEKNFSTSVISNFAGDIFPRADFGFETIEAPDFNAKILLIQKNLEFQFLLLPILTGSFINGGSYFDEVDGFSSLGDGNRLLPKIKSNIRKNKNNSFFLTSFFSVTHFPYSPPFPDYKKFTDKNYFGDYKYFKFVDPTNDKKPSEKDIEQIRAVFDSSIYSFDKSFGELIQFLKKEKLYDNSIIILTGDHGESIYEDVHGHGHGEHLRGDFVTHVPLIIKFPKSFIHENTNQEIESITSSIDLFPTILEFYKIDPNKIISGKSLLGELNKKELNENRMIYSETGIWFSDLGDHFFQSQRIPYPSILKLHTIVPDENFQIMITDNFYRETIAFSKHRMIQTNRYKLIYIPTREAVIFEFYDKLNDPLNQTNLAYLNLPEMENMKKELYRLAKEKEKAEIIADYIFPENLE